MNMRKKVPAVVPLDFESVVHLQVVRTWLDVFPSTLRKFARLNLDDLHRSIRSKEMPTYRLLSGAYIGFAPLPTSYGRFITQVERVNKAEPHPESFVFRKDAVARENSAASEYGMSRGELKRLLKSVDEMAERAVGISYQAIFNCKEEIHRDPSPFAPVDREAYAEGPLYLWDFAKSVSEHKLADMCFDTFEGWVLFVHLEDSVVAGHAILPRAHRLGDFYPNPFVDDIHLRMLGDDLSPIIDVPQVVYEAVRELAARRFPDKRFEFIPPPMVGRGLVVPSKMVPVARRRHRAEV